MHLLLFTLYINSRIGEDEEIKSDISVLEKELSGSLDNSIRQKLRKQGVSITQTIFCGFDTEYKNTDPVTNLLLSTQLAINTQISIKFPLNSGFEQPENPETASTASTKPDTILEQIKLGIEIYRKSKYPGHDDSLNKIIQGLRDEGKKVLEDKERDDITFQFPHTDIKQLFNKVNSGKYTLKELVTTSKSLVKSDLDQSLADLYKTLKEIHEAPEKLPGFEEHKSSEVVNAEKELTDLPRETFETTDTGSDSISDPSRVLEEEKPENRRTWMSSFTSQKVSVSVKKQMYLLIHNAAADLSILSDFDEFKDGLDLVNKCFVTLGDPLNVCGIDVKIRDTTLLAPGGGKSLRAISTLYPGVPKLSVSKKDIENMDLF